VKLGVKMWVTKINPDQDGQGLIGGCSLAQTSGELPVPSAALKFTARPGTIVEIACL
jgi:hypothetical protein